MTRRSLDQLMKQVVQARFVDVLRLFDPERAAGLDLDHAPTFLNTETFSDTPQRKRRIPDVVAQVRTRTGVPEFVNAHVEIQQRREREDFAHRMWRYYIALLQRDDKPIISIALLFYATAEGIAWEVYEEKVLGQTTATFRYLQVSLPRLSPDAYLQTGNVLGAALASVMGRSLRRAKRAELYVTCLQRLMDAERQGDIDRDTANLLNDVVETYLPISGEDRTALRVQWEREGRSAETMKTTELTWQSRIDQEVTIRTRREDIREIVHRKFGRVAPEIEALIDGTDSEDDLKALFGRAIDARTEHDVL